METLKKEPDSPPSDTMNANESRGTSSTETSTNEKVNVAQLAENQKTPVAIQPKLHPDEPKAKRLKVVPQDDGVPTLQVQSTTTPASEIIENEKDSGIREEPSTPTAGTSDESNPANERPSTSGTPATPAKSKPAKEQLVVGSEKWKELKRVSHMEVERRRRETINDHINQLARMIPTENRQKGAILRATVAYIKTLKEQHDTDTQKWALEKLVAEQTIRQLQEEMEKYRTRYHILKKATKSEHDDSSENDSDNEQQTANRLHHSSQ